MENNKEQEKENICNDFSCEFAGTKLCVEESCNKCKLYNCKGCRHLWVCIEEEAFC